MSSVLCPIAVDLDKVRGAIGSKNKALIGRVRRAHAGILDQIDEMLAEDLDEGEGEGDAEPFTTADALRHLVMGEPRRDDVGFAYGYCFEALCLHFGDMLNNSEWSAMRVEWFATVQKELGKAGVTAKQFSLEALVFRGPPVKLDINDDSPCVGYLTKSQVPKARAALAKADLSKLKNKAAVASVEQVRSWLGACATSKRDLVCTYS